MSAIYKTKKHSNQEELRDACNVNFNVVKAFPHEIYTIVNGDYVLFMAHISVKHFWGSELIIYNRKTVFKIRRTLSIPTYNMVSAFNVFANVSATHVYLPSAVNFTLLSVKIWVNGS